MSIPINITLDYLKKLDDGGIIGKNGRTGIVPLTSDIIIKNLFELGSF